MNYVTPENYDLKYSSSDSGKECEFPNPLELGSKSKKEKYEFKENSKRTSLLYKIKEEKQIEETLN